MIELKISNGKYLTHEDLEMYLNEYEEYYRSRFKEGLTQFEWNELINEGNNEIEKSLSKFDKIELIVEDIEFNEKFYPRIYFPKPTGRDYIDKHLDRPIKLRGENFFSFSTSLNNENDEYEDFLNGIYKIEFRDIKIKNPKTPPYREDTISKFSVPEFLFYKFDINKPIDIKRGSRFVFNLNILKKVKYKGSQEIISLTYIETAGIFSKLIYKTNLKTNSSNSNCFIVTTTMGDINHPVVVDYRQYRDNVLLKTHIGRLFINLYYKIGPYFSIVIQKSEILFKISKWVILKFHQRIINSVAKT